MFPRTPTNSASSSRGSQRSTTFTGQLLPASCCCAMRLAKRPRKRAFVPRFSTPPRIWTSARAGTPWSQFASPCFIHRALDPPNLGRPQTELNIEKILLNCQLPDSLSEGIESEEAGAPEFMLIRDVFAVAMHLMTSLAVWPHMVRAHPKPVGALAPPASHPQPRTHACSQLNIPQGVESNPNL